MEPGSGSPTPFERNESSAMIDGSTFILLAYEAAEKAAEGEAGAAAAQHGMPWWYWPSMITFVLFVFLVLRPGGAKEDKKLKKLIESLKRNDRVVTVGGLYGIVAHVKPDSDEVVLKIDEDKDVKITVTKSAILRKDSTDADAKAVEK